VENLARPGSGSSNRNTRSSPPACTSAQSPWNAGARSSPALTVVPFLVTSPVLRSVQSPENLHPPDRGSQASWVQESPSLQVSAWLMHLPALQESLVQALPSLQLMAVNWHPTWGSQLSVVQRSPSLQRAARLRHWPVFPSQLSVVQRSLSSQFLVVCE